MYSWMHVLLATACALLAWYSLYRATESAVDKPQRPAQYAIAWARRTHLAGLMGVQRVDRAGVVLTHPAIRRGVTVSDGSGVNSQRTISVSLVAAVVQDDQQPRQALDHVTGVGEERLRHHHVAVTAHRRPGGLPAVAGAPW